MKGTVIISAAVEGIVDEAVTRKLITEAGGRPGTIYGKNGKPFLRRHINGYNNAARHLPLKGVLLYDYCLYNSQYASFPGETLTYIP